MSSPQHPFEPQTDRITLQAINVLQNEGATIPRELDITIHRTSFQHSVGGCPYCAEDGSGPLVSGPVGPNSDAQMAVPPVVEESPAAHRWSCHANHVEQYEDSLAFRNAIHRRPPWAIVSGSIAANSEHPMFLPWLDELVLAERGVSL